MNMFKELYSKQKDSLNPRVFVFVQQMVLPHSILTTHTILT